MYIYGALIGAEEATGNAPFWDEMEGKPAESQPNVVRLDMKCVKTKIKQHTINGQRFIIQF